MDFLKENFPAASIAPFVAALLTTDVPASGELFAVGGGRAARMFLAEVPGLIGYKTVDCCLRGFDCVVDATEFSIPVSMDDVMGYARKQVGIDPTALTQTLADISGTR